MEPRIQYAKTSDGVNIAYCVMGEGRPLVFMPDPPWFHVQLMWQIPELRQLWERLAETRMLVRFDMRGHGLSQREVAGYSLEEYLLDLQAVVDQLRLETFVLFGLGSSCPVAISYAADNPDRVSHLIVSGWARASDHAQAPQTQSLGTLMSGDWDLFTEAAAHAALGWGAGESARMFAAFIRGSVTQEAARRALAASLTFDVTDRLSQVRAPTLILQPRTARLLPAEAAQDVAAAISDARLVLLEGESHALFVGEERREAVLRAVDDFTGVTHRETRPRAELPSGTAIILFADIADSTALTERLGDTAFREKARDLDGSLRAVIRENGGTPVEGKLLGDGVLAVFTSARQAIEAARRCNTLTESTDLRLHLGLHAGDVIREENNVYGGAVNIAARIAAASAPGEVLVSDTVRGLARTSAGVTFEDRGEQSLKGVSEPVRVFAVREGDV